MTRFQLIFRRDGEPDQSEFRYNDEHGGPHINGTLIDDGQTYVIRGVEWLVSRDDDGQTDMKRFVCTLIADPAADIHAL